MLEMLLLQIKVQLVALQIHYPTLMVLLLAVVALGKMALMHLAQTAVVVVMV
jgi:hypothetical protein